MSKKQDALCIRNEGLKLLHKKGEWKDVRGLGGKCQG